MLEKLKAISVDSAHVEARKLVHCLWAQSLLEADSDSNLEFLGCSFGECEGHNFSSGDSLSQQTDDSLGYNFGFA